jgi:S1-C subfamily serine protease
MKRSIVSLLAVSALALAACTSGSTRTTAEPRAEFPSASAAAVPDEGGVVGVVRDVLPAVVNVVASSDQEQGEGTGFIVRSDGIVVTNFHVVEGASEVTVLTSDEDPVSYKARVIGGDVQDDLAVLDIEATDLPTVPLGRSADLELGQRVVAIGYALGLAGGPSVTTGVVSSLTRQVTVQDPNCPTSECGPDQERVYTDVIQTDAAINPGNSGGPLVNLAGEVVGINSAGAGSAENIGFAIQIDAAEPVIFQAAENPSEPVAFMGVGSSDASDPEVQFEFNPPVEEGAMILNVVENGPADRAGIQVGDVVVTFDGQPVTDSERLGELIRSLRPGDEVQVGVVHPDGSQEELTVRLGVNPVPTG